MNDPILEEVWRVRDEYAARFNYDLDAIYRDLKEQEKRSGRTFVNFGKKACEPASTDAEPPIQPPPPASATQQISSAVE